MTGSTITKYYFAGGTRIAMRKDGALYYLLGDHLGSTSLVTDVSGNVVSETKYKAWGEVRYSSGVTPTEYQFTSQYSYAGEFGLLYYNARFYDPALARFISPDTIIPNNQGVQAWDRYAYANNNPMLYIDPTGHCIDACVIEAFAVLTVFAFITAYIYTTPEMQELGNQFAKNLSANIEDAVEGVAALFAEVSQPLDEGKNTNESPVVDPADILMPDGQPIGKDGRQGEHIREVEEGEVAEIWDDLSEAGAETTYPNYDGDVLELADGTIVGLRDSKQHGATIDILKGENIPYEKIHGPWKPQRE